MTIPEEYLEDFEQEADSIPSHGVVKLIYHKSPGGNRFEIEKNRSYPPMRDNNCNTGVNND
jgi:hypothetical protein